MSQPTSSGVKTDVLADESFMSADQLKSYMADLQMAKASKMLDAMQKADDARQKLVNALQEEVEVNEQLVARIKHNLAVKTRAAAERGEREVMVMRFPSALCTDKGRALNNSEPDWPTTLTGRPRQAYEFWREHLKPANYRLRAMIVEWPNGMPGDVAFILAWP